MVIIGRKFFATYAQQLRWRLQGKDNNTNSHSKPRPKGNYSYRSSKWDGNRFTSPPPYRGRQETIADIPSIVYHSHFPFHYYDTICRRRRTTRAPPKRLSRSAASNYNSSQPTNSFVQWKSKIQIIGLIYSTRNKKRGAVAATRAEIHT